MSKLSRLVNPVPGLLAFLVTPLSGWAQHPGIEAPATPPGPASQAVGGVTAVVAILLVGGIAGKLYDLKRRREDDAASLQSRISDAVLLDSSLAAFPIVVSAWTPLWRRRAAVVEIAGTVPTPELRDTAIRLIERELSRIRPDTRTEDRVVIDPHVAR
jgi:hypothetical protein